MTILDHLVQGEDNSGFNARWVIGCQAKRLSDAVSGFEAYAINVTFQLVGVLLHGFQGCFAIGFVDFDSQICANSMTVQEKHDLLNLLLLFPGGDNLAGAILSNARNFQQAFRLVFDNIEGCFPKMIYNSLG